MIAATPAALAKRARAIAAQLAGAGVEADVVETMSTVGGGSLPEETQPSRAVAIGARHGRANDIASRLRAGDPPIVARVVDDRAALDLRSVAPEDDELLARTVTAALAKEK
jgi:L-seryl-tRNA(Ser) seleniumtransferase